MKIRWLRNLLPIGLALVATCSAGRADESPALKLVLRSRAAVEGDAGLYRIVEQSAEWEPARTAVVICDMWDQHHCRNAASRVAEMALRMNDVVGRLRQQGVLIIHCPSNTMKFYQDHPGRKLAQSAPQVKTNVLPQGWCSLDNQRESELPIDDSDGGCDSSPAEQQKFSAELKAMGRDPGNPWTRQIATIEIKEGDAITDDFQAFYLMKQRGITNVIVMGVHTNMCVLGRPFSIRQMVRQGQAVVLVRDLTDTMYNPSRAPYVSHFTGTDLVVEHIEKYWCPTITSDQLVGGNPFRFQADQRKRLVLILADDEYRTTHTVPEFAARYLGHEFQTERAVWEKHGAQSLSGLSTLDQADVVLMSLWRRTLPKQQLERMRRYVAAGKPLVAIRTSSHGLASRDGTAPPGHEQWPDFDREVLGGHYQGHHGNHGETPEKTTYIWVPQDRPSHPILHGVATSERSTPSWLYKMAPLAKQSQVLLMGRVGSRQPQEPVAWTNVSPAGGRVFYTSLGHPKEFEDQDFQRMLFNAVYWTAGLDVPRELPKPAP